MAGTVPKFYEFNSDVDDWGIYSERLEQHFVVNQVNDEKIKVAVLLSSISQGTFKLLKDLSYPTAPQNKTFIQLTELLKTQFSVIKSVWRERIKFYSLTQENLNVSEWYAKVRGTSTLCNFGGDLLKVLKDKFVTGLSPGKVLDRICEEDESKTLEELFAIALKTENFVNEVRFVSSNRKFRSRQVEDSSSVNQSGNQNRSSYRSRTGRDRPELRQQQERHHSCQNKNFQHGSNNNKPYQGNAKQNHISKRKCVHCGSNHKNECYFKFSKCRLCNRTGHIAKICFKNKNKHVNFIDENVNEDSNCNSLDNNEVFELYSNYKVADNKHDFNIEISIDNKNIKFLCDSGSAISAVNHETYLKYFSSYRLLKDSTLLRGYDGSIFEPQGFFLAYVTFNGKTKENRFYVVRNGGTNILGRDWMANFQVKIDFINNISVNQEINKIISKYSELFSNKLGKYKHSKVNLELNENVSPVFCKYRTVPLAFRESVDKELKKLEEEGVITQIEHSDWTTPIVAVIKNDKTIRMCGDYKISVNKHLKPINYPLPRIDEVFAKLNKAQYFSKIDLRSAYNQIEVTEDTAKLLALTTPRGIFKVNRMPFGITPATSIFQKIIEQTLQGIEGVVSFVDDIVISGTTKVEHNRNLEEVFKKLQAAGFTLRRDKCKFFEKEIVYLGFKISKDGLKKNRQ